MSKAKELRKRLSAYVSGAMTTREFRDWFAPFLLNVRDESDAEKLAYATEWEFCDFQRGKLASESALKENLARLCSDSLPVADAGFVLDLASELHPPVAGRVEILSERSGNSGESSATFVVFPTTRQNESFSTLSDLQLTAV